MSYQVLARKWRPKRFADLVGQEHVVRALSNALKEQRLHHAYLLTGTRGVGKTTIARILAKSLNCETGTTAEPCGECSACRQIDTGRFVDLLEIDAASNTGIDNIREVLENAQYAPTAGRFKVYIIDEVHMLSKSAFNAMLKTLEEPPAHVKFILATTDPQKVPVTVLSRCLQFSLRNMTPQQVAGHLAHVLDSEQVEYEPPALSLLGRAAAGSMRDALSLLDQAIAYGMGQVKEEGVRSMLGAVDRRYLFVLLQALVDRDGASLMQEAAGLAARGMAFDGVLTELAVLLQQIAMAQTVPDAIPADEPEREIIFALASQISVQDIQLFYQIVIHGKKDLPLAPDEHAGFNMTLLRMLAFYPGNLSGGALPKQESAGPSLVQRALPDGRSATPPNVSGQAGDVAGVNGANAAKALLARLSGKKTDSPAPVSAVEQGRAVAERPVATASPAVVPIQPVVPAVVATEPAKPVSGFESDEINAYTESDSQDDDVLANEVAGFSDPVEPYVDDPVSVNEARAFDGNWSDLVATLGARLGAARMLAHNAVLKSWSATRLELAVPESFKHMAGRDYQEKLRSALAEYFGQSMDLTVSVEELGLETPAMKDARNRQELLMVARESMQNDPVVQQFVKEFNATLLTETIQPV